MKKTILLLVLMQSIIVGASAQVTHYGLNSGTGGSDACYFGEWAGFFATTGFDNSFFGYESGRQVTTGFGNSAIGARTLYYNNGSSNTASGSYALYSNTDGYSNTANGRNSLHLNQSGYQNTAVGMSALYNNRNGDDNTASGYKSLYSNTEGYGNTANGFLSLYSNTTGDYNVANGSAALHWNTTGGHNVAQGRGALYHNQTGEYNSATGTWALYSNTSGNYNSANGYDATYRNTTGSYNSSVGAYALYYNTTGSYNTALGSDAGPSSSTPGLQNSTAVGYRTITTASNQVRIGNTSVASIGGQVSWSTLSDGRFKKEIKEDVSGLEFIKQLRPVSYSVDLEKVDNFLRVPDSVKQQLSAGRKKDIRQTGFIAQEVEAVIKKTGYIFHGVEAPESENDHYSIRYAEFVVPLVKAVQELTAKVELQEKIGIEQKEEIQSLKEQLKLTGQSTYDDPTSKTEAVLYQNNPNPFTLDTEIRMALSETTRQATLMIYNLEGKQLKVMPILDRGNTQIKIQGNELKAGMYIYSLIVDGKVVDTKRMILTGN